MKRPDGRARDELRPVKINRHFTSATPGSVLIELGNTKVICTASLDMKIPEFLKGRGKGWVTAEYGMLPGSTPQRKMREVKEGRTDGRSQEIQRLIGRSLRAITDTELLGENTIWLDCDVLEADGGTRTAAITGAFIALYDTVHYMLKERIIVKDPIRDYLAAVSVGRLNNENLLDLCYTEDSRAEVDLNVIMTGKGELVEIQGTAEGKPFLESDLFQLLKLAKKGITELVDIQKSVLTQMSTDSPR